LPFLPVPKGRGFPAKGCNDPKVIGCMKELQKNGLRVSQGVSTVGFDNISLASLVTSSLRTMAQPAYEMRYRGKESAH
jgi:DNA-binding LacI/PurR family transcriptional regulator